jgi:hypothetical protein
MLELQNFYPINLEVVKKRWHEIMNIPNNAWEEFDVERNINLINNTNAPHTLRTVQLNLLPALVIEIIRFG